MIYKSKGWRWPVCSSLEERRRNVVEKGGQTRSRSGTGFFRPVLLLSIAIYERSTRLCHSTMQSTSSSSSSLAWTEPDATSLQRCHQMYHQLRPTHSSMVLMSFTKVPDSSSLAKATWRPVTYDACRSVFLFCGTSVISDSYAICNAIDTYLSYRITIGALVWRSSIIDLGD